MERKNSRNRRTLQRLAADLMMQGLAAPEVASRLGIRLSTLLRWQEKPIFTQRIELHRATMGEEMRLDVIRALRESARYACEKPGGNLNTMKMIVQVIKMSKMVVK